MRVLVSVMDHPEAFKGVGPILELLERRVGDYTPYLLLNGNRRKV